MKLLDVLEKKKIFYNLNYNKPKVSIKILGNIVLDHLIPYIEYNLSACHHNVKCEVENYDNIIQDLLNIKKEADVIIIFFELTSYIEKIINKKDNFKTNEIKEFSENIKNQLKLIFSSVDHDKLVIFNNFNINIFEDNPISINKLNNLCEELNKFLKTNAPKNFKLVDNSSLLNEFKISKCINLDLYKKTKILYTQLFYYNYSLKINSLMLSKLGNFKKVLVLDCDNTLWNGILGEDGENNIEYNENTDLGKSFFKIQTYAKQLVNKGVILCICSKNNYQDVKNFLLKNKMVLKENDFTILKINWNSKVNNLQEISNQLNLPLDSFILIDDSDFEINYINKFLPQVLTMKVPKNIHQYPQDFKNLFNFFNINSLTKEDTLRQKYYSQDISRKEIKSNFNNINDYLQSLKIELSIKIDDEKNIKRIHQLINKTNQFNFTTIRYNINEVSNFRNLDQYSVISLSVKDIFGDSGLTGVIIIKYIEKIAFIDTFLLSCRIIGRKIEYTLIDYIMNYLKNKNILILESKFIFSDKNSQVQDFYENIGMNIIKKNSEFKHYQINISNYIPSNTNFIKINE